MAGKTEKEPPVDPRKPSPDPRPASHSTGGRKDHEIPGEGEGPERPANPPRP